MEVVHIQSQCQKKTFLLQPTKCREENQPNQHQLAPMHNDQMHGF